MRGLEGVIEDIFLYDLSFFDYYLGPDSRSRVDNGAVLKHASGTDYGVVLDTAEQTDFSVVVDDASRDCALTADLDMVVDG